MSQSRLEGVEAGGHVLQAAAAFAAPKIFPPSPRYFGSHRLH